MLEIFGAIARTVECLGADVILIPEKNFFASINADAIKLAGALLNIKVCRTPWNLQNAIDFIKNCGIQIISCTEKAYKTIYDANYCNPTAIILGPEEDGISKRMNTCK